MTPSLKFSIPHKYAYDNLTRSFELFITNSGNCTAIANSAVCDRGIVVEFIMLLNSPCLWFRHLVATWTAQG